MRPDLRARRRVQVDAALALHAPVGEQLQLAAQQRVVVGRQRAGVAAASATAPARAIASRISASARGVVARRRRRAARRGRACCRGRSSSRKPCVGVLRRAPAGALQPGARAAARRCATKGARPPAAAARPSRCSAAGRARRCGSSAGSWRRREAAAQAARDRGRGAGAMRCEPGVERGAGGRGRPRRWRRGRWARTGAWAAAIGGAAEGLVDNRFYKPPAPRACAGARRHPGAPPPASHRSRSACRVPLPTAPARPLLTPLAAALAAALAGAGARAGRAGPTSRIALRPSPALQPPPRGDAADRAADHPRRADASRGRPDLDTVAEGNVEFRRGGTVHPRRPAELRPAPTTSPRAHGNVRISRDGNRLQRPRAAAAGAALRGLLPRARRTSSRAPAPAARAERIDFLDSQRARAPPAPPTPAARATAPASPAWLLSTPTA